MNSMYHLKRDLINAGLESLLKIEHPDYFEKSMIDHRKADTIVAAIMEVTDAQDYKVVVQALFESGFLSIRDSDFSCDQLFACVYGVKVHHALETFNNLHIALMRAGHIDAETSYNSSGDNYYSAYEFMQKPAKIAQSVADRGHVWPTDIMRKVIVVENQSPMYAYVLEHSIFTGEPSEFYMVQLRAEYDEDVDLPGLIGAEFEVDKVYGWDAYDLHKTKRIITTLKIDGMMCNPVLEPKRIEGMLFNLYSGLCSIVEDGLISAKE